MVNDIETVREYTDPEQRIRFWIKSGLKCAVACSFGKDSMAVLHMALKYDPNIPVVFCNTGIEFKETIQFKDQMVRQYDLNLQELHPTKTFWECLKEYGLPSVSRWKSGTPKCCYYLKEKPALDYYRANNIKVVFTGIRQEESSQRHKSICFRGQEHFCSSYGHYRIHPIARWIWQEVEDYHSLYMIPQNPAYKFVNRIGCAYCPAHINWEQQVSLLFPKVYEAIQKIGKQELLRCL